MAIGLVATLGALVAACGGGSASGNGNTVNWWTWDDKQAAAYQSCASGFEKANPGTTVKIGQYNVDTITKAGYPPADLAKLTWNPDDGGMFEKVAAHLSVHHRRPGDDQRHRPDRLGQGGDGRTPT